jgi:superfamily II DNA or RNA helicase
MLIIASIVGAVVAASGAVAASLRPAARARRKARRALKRVRREERALHRVEAKTDTALRTSATEYAAFRRDERLRAVPVDELRSYGAERVRWELLKEAGFETVADLKQARAGDLTRLKGVGGKSAAKILAASKDLTTVNAEEPVLPPGIDADAAPEVSAVRAARDSLLVRDELTPHARGLSELEHALAPRFKEVRRGTSLIRGAFAGPEARAFAVDDAHAIASEVQAAESPEGVVGQARAARERTVKRLATKPEPEELRLDHERRFADYSIAIEQALAGGASKAAPASKALGGLPDEIAARVEAFELQLAGLQVTLRGYQAFGTKYMLVQQRTLIGDEMGLGKTMEALAAMVHIEQAEGAQHFLVVCPASVLHNWLREVSTRTALTSHLLHGSEREEAFARWRTEGGVAVTSFSTLRRLTPLYTAEGDDAKLDLLVVDEAHLVKNPEAERTRAVAALVQRTPRACFLTGTPIENKLIDFRNLIAMLQPTVADAVGQAPTPAGDLMIGRNAFRRAVAPVYLRRNQRDVLHELPPRIDMEEWVELTGPDGAAYRDAVLAREIMSMRRTATLGDDTGGSPKLDRLADLLEEYREEGRKVLIFSFFLDVLEAVGKRFPPVGVITGSVDAEERLAMCDAFSETDGHALLLAQIQAGGVGLNLQAASAVVLMEPQWKPSTEEQAIARAHRMGQARTVVVHKLLAKDSVDERMKEILAEKSELFDAFARESVVKEASAEATETSMTRRVIEAEVERLQKAGELEAAPEQTA